LKKKSKKTRLPKSDINIKKRLTIFAVSSSILLIALVLRIAYLQFATTVSGRNLRVEAQRQQLQARTIIPRRGNLLDATGRGLAFSAPVDTISVNPSRLRTTTGEELCKEEVAESLSNIFELDYEEVLALLNSEATSVRIMERSTLDQTTKLEEWLTEANVLGVTITPNTQRFYPYNNLASNLIGFTRYDGHGATGLEHSLDHLLAGTPGRVVTITDSLNVEIPDRRHVYIEAQDGYDVYLTIDANIQAISERHLSRAIRDSRADRW